MEIDLKEINNIGAGIMRPEGVVVQKDGTVLAADARGQIARRDSEDYFPSNNSFNLSANVEIENGF